jgi:hypothetical protein
VSETPHPFAVGDRVICNPAEISAKYHGIVWKIERINRVNVVLRPVEGGGRGLVIHPAALLPAPADGSIPASTVIPYEPPLSVGAVVTVASARWKGGDHLYSVLGDNGDTLCLAMLGGNHNQIWSKVPRGWATEVDRTALLAAVAGLRRPA